MNKPYKITVRKWTYADQLFYKLRKILNLLPPTSVERDEYRRQNAIREFLR